ncbi:MAG: AraC family transcriptional regulator [Bacteroidales bacterium]
MKQYTFKTPLLFEFELKDLAEVTQRKQTMSGVPHRTDFYEIIFIESGESVQMLDFAPIQVSKGQILFIGKNQVVRFDTSTSYSGKIALFTDMFFSRVDCEVSRMKLQNLFSPFTGNMPIVANEVLNSLFSLLQQEFNATHDGFQADLIHSLLNAFLIETARQSLNESNISKGKDYAIALQFSKLVEEHYHTLRKVNDYLDIMRITAKPLSKALQSTIGKTPKQYLDERILLEAKRLLVYSNESIKEVSFLLNFDEATNFSKFFREQTGLSPAEFKKQTTP